VDDILIATASQRRLRKMLNFRWSPVQAWRTGSTLELTDKARDFLADAGYDPVYGARPLRRAIQHYLQDKLAPMLLAGEFKEGDTIKVDADAAGLTFQREEPLKAVAI
jgi:ATP-dependent Clp protease ATP-binding subunit ClpB